jgi:NADH-quinone oxidoreductase subunit L
MTVTLIPLALLGLLGGILNLPEYLAHGFLSGFLGAIPSFAATEQASHAKEIILQIIASAAALFGIGLAWSRYMGTRRAAVLAREEAGSPLTLFLLNGWKLDSLYRLLFIRPFELLARFFWKGVDEAGIDGFLDGLARVTARLGQVSAGWSTGKVATSLFGLAGGVCVVLAYVVWLIRG